MAEGIRRRKGRDEGGADSSANKALDSLKAFDVYTKVSDEYVQKSQAGGIVTMITSFVVAVLLFHEIKAFLTVEVLDTITVDTRLHQKLSIGLNMTFPHLRCDEVSVDNVDSAGDNQVNVQGNIEKLPLDMFGRITAGDPAVKEGDCLPCLEGEDETHKCCNTCQELKEAYTAKEISVSSILETSEQCKSSVGCRVDGSVIVSKVSGNVHVALGRSTVRGGRHVHEFNMADVSNGFNTSHELHAVSFGEQVEGVTSPLDGTMKIVKSGAFMFHYYIKLVPTVFTDRWGGEVYTNQYSFTDSAKNVQVRNGELSGLPGVFIVYDFSPFLVRKTEVVKPWSYILKSLCAIIGGLISIATLVEKGVSTIGTTFAPCLPPAHANAP